MKHKQQGHTCNSLMGNPRYFESAADRVSYLDLIRDRGTFTLHFCLTQTDSRVDSLDKEEYKAAEEDGSFEEESPNKKTS